MKTAVIYARYSSDKQTEQSIEGQLRVCNDYAKSHDIMVIDTYIDRAMTGTNDQRDDFQRMMRDARKQAWDYVLVYKFDRFSRDKYESTIHKHTLKEYGIKVISAMENIPDSPEGIILEALLEGMNQYYSMELAQKVARGMNENRRKGFFTGGRIPFGYKVTDKKIEVDENDSVFVIQIFQAFAAGAFVKDIVADLNGRGITNHGCKFTTNMVYCILRSEKYIGIHRHGDEVFLNSYPAIVPKDLFEFVRTKIEENKYGRHSKDVVFLLKNKAHCGYCGAPVSSDSGTSASGEVKRYYKCRAKKNGSNCQNRSVPKEPFEKLIVDVTLKVLGDEKLLNTVADRIVELNKQHITENSAVNILTKELQETQKALDNILSAIEQGLVTPSTKTRLAELENKKLELENNIMREKASQEYQIPRSDILRYLKAAIKKSPALMIRLLIKDVILYEDKIEIHYNYSKTKPDDNDRRAFCFYEDGIDLTYSSARMIEYGEMEHFTASRHFLMTLWI